MGDHEACIFEVANLALTRSKGMRSAKAVMNTTISIGEREKDFKSKCHDPYGRQCNITGGGMIGLSANIWISLTHVSARVTIMMTS